MTALLSILTACTMTGQPAVDCGPPPIHGLISQYDPWLMWETAVQQHEWGRIADLSRYDGFIATADCDIGREGYLSIEGGAWLFVVVADCAGHASTYQWMKAANVICEVSHSLAGQHGIIGRGGIEGSIRWIN